MTLFYAVVEGDPLTSGEGSCVLAGVASSTIEGPDGRHRDQTILGQKAWCAACQSAGEIMAAPGSPTRLRTGFDIGEFHGLEALGGDLVLCKCARHPEVISVYGRTVTINDYASDSSVPFSSSSGDATASGVTYDQHFLLRDERTGEPLMGLPYKITTEDGQEVEGHTDASGHTQKIVGEGAQQASITVFEGHAPINPDWDK